MTDLSKGGGAFAKAVQKTLSRTKTKVLQRVGKAEKTSDDSFKENVENFHKQQAAALRLQKELKHYLACVKSMTAAATSLYNVIKETYEEDWLDPHTSLDLMQTNYKAELEERVYNDLNTYIDQFPIYKEKINKRRRKMLDYDNAKHERDSLLTAKKPDHAKICKAEESLKEAKSMFDEINTELHKDLPHFYDYRIEFTASNLSRLFSAEGTYHNNCGKLSDKLVEVLQSLATTHAEEVDRLQHQQEGSHNSRPDRSALFNDENEALDLSSLSAKDAQSLKTNGHQEETTMQISQSSQNRPSELSSNPEPGNSKQRPARPSEQPKASLNSPDKQKTSFDNTPGRNSHDKISKPKTPPPAPPVSDGSNPFLDADDNDETIANSDRRIDSGNPFLDDDDDETETVKNSEIKSEEKETNVVRSSLGSSVKDSTITEGKPSASTSVTADGPTLYQVMATHPYTAEDEDELTFEPGEIINVVEFDDQDEQDEGWLMGIMTSTNIKGVFPANFTQRIPDGQKAT